MKPVGLVRIMSESPRKGRGIRIVLRKNGVPDGCGKISFNILTRTGQMNFRKYSNERAICKRRAGFRGIRTARAAGESAQHQRQSEDTFREVLEFHDGQEPASREDTLPVRSSGISMGIRSKCDP